MYVEIYMETFMELVKGNETWLTDLRCDKCMIIIFNRLCVTIQFELGLK